MANAAVNAQNPAAFAGASLPTIDADITAMADDTATTNWRDEPNIAQSTSPTGAVERSLRRHAG
ncbi:MAG: hypothetical protein R3A10_01430 [Caldilineaceae bacterium]